MPATTLPTDLRSCRLSPPQLAKVLGPHVWIDPAGCAQEFGGELVVTTTSVTAPAEALRFMADNVDDYLAEHPQKGMVAWSWTATAQRLRRAADGLTSTPSGR